MHPLVAEKLPRLRGLCRRHKVRSLWLFGSAAADGARPFDTARSDFDFLVEFEPIPEGSRADAYFTLREDLMHLLGRPVDLVMTGAVRNPYFAASLDSTKVPLYAAA